VCVGFAQTQLPQQRAVTTVGRLPKTAAHVVLVQNQLERAAAMHGKALVFSAFVLALGISATSAQSLFEQRAKCQKYADDFIKKNGISNRSDEYGEYKITSKSNYDIKLENCYLLITKIYTQKKFKDIFSDITSNHLYDAITQELLAYTFEDKAKQVGEIRDTYFIGLKDNYQNTKKYIADKMKTER